MVLLIIKAKKTLMNNKGQAVIEAIYASTAVMAAITSVLALGYFAFLKFFVDYQLSEALICTSSYNLSKSTDCKKKLRTSLKKTNSLAEIKYLEIKKLKTHIAGKVVLKPFKSLEKVSLSYTKTIALPLETR